MKIVSKIIKYFSYISSVLIIGIVLFIYFYFAYRSRKVLNLEFIFDKPRGIVLGEEGGIFPAIIGSIMFSTTAIILAFIPAICSSIYIKFYASKKFRDFAHTLIESIASIPSIVLGLFSYSLFVYKLGFGRCILSSGIALGIMVLPFMERRIEKSFDEINVDMIEASSNMGIAKYYMITKLIIKSALPEIVSTILLCYGFAMGALAPMIFTGAVAYSSIPDSILKPSMALPMHLYLQIAQGEIQLDRAYATAFVELMVLLICNIIAYCLAESSKKNQMGIIEFLKNKINKNYKK